MGNGVGLIRDLLAIGRGEKKGDAAPLIFLMKSVCGLLEVSESRRAPIVNIVLPEAASREQYLSRVQEETDEN